MHGSAVGLHSPRHQAYDSLGTSPVFTTRRRVVLSSVISLTVTLLALFLIVEHRERALIVRQMEKRGETIATHLAAVSRKSLLTYNFVTLGQDAAQTAQTRDVLYVIILDRAGRVATYSGHHEQQGLVPADTVSQKAAQAQATLIQYVPHTQRAAEHYDIAVPVFVAGSTEKWGTVRVGLSLHEMQREIGQSRRQVLILGVLGVAFSLAVTAFLERIVPNPQRGT